MSVRDRFSLDEHGKRHFTLDAEPGSLSGKIHPLGKKPALHVIPLGPHLMTPRGGKTVPAAGANLEIQTVRALRWVIKDHKTIWLDLGNNSCDLTFGTVEECDRAIEQFREQFGASNERN